MRAMTEKEIIERRIFLKRQLILLTEKEINTLEHELSNLGSGQVDLEVKT